MPTRAFAPLAAVAALALALVSARLCAAPAAASALPAHELTAQDAQAWPDGLMPTALRTARAPGAVISIVKDGQVLFEKGYGYADEKTRTPVDPKRTLFRPGATSKAIDESPTPVNFSHSNARALVDHPRNIPDDLIKACAARGGVGGVNGIGIFLGDNDASLARVFGGNWLRVAREVWQPPF